MQAAFTLSLLIDAALAEQSRHVCLSVFASELSCRKSFPAEKRWAGSLGALWKRDEHGPELKDQDAGNLRSRVGRRPFRVSDELGNQLNYAANEPPRVPLPRRGPERSSARPSVRPSAGPLSQQQPLIMAPNGIPSAVYFFFSVFSVPHLVFFCVSLFCF